MHHWEKYPLMLLQYLQDLQENGSSECITQLCITQWHQIKERGVISEEELQKSFRRHNSHRHKKVEYNLKIIISIRSSGV